MLDSLLFVLATGFSYLFQRKCQGCCQKRGKKNHFCVAGNPLLEKKTQQGTLKAVLLKKKKKRNLLIHDGNLYFLRTNASIREYIFHRGNFVAGFGWVFQYIWSLCKYYYYYYCKYYSSQRWTLSIISISILPRVGLSVSRYSYRKKYFISVLKR